MNKTVSVIITTCGREPAVVEEAIRSVINQTYSNIEVIVVNDAPAYQERKALENMIQKYDGVMLFTNEEQKGANYSRNYGASKSKGYILSFLDDDDYWASNRIELIVAEIEKGFDIVYSDYVMFSKTRTWYNKRFLPDKDIVVQRILAGNFLGGFSVVSFTRDVFEKSGKLDEEMPSYQDQDLFIRMLQVGKLSYIDKPLCYYRVSTTSISLNEDKKLRGLILLLDKYKDLFNHYPESEKYRLECELIYAEKQGWKHNSDVIANLLLKYDGKAKVLSFRIKGRAKHIGVKLLKMQ